MNLYEGFWTDVHLWTFVVGNDNKNNGKLINVISIIVPLYEEVGWRGGKDTLICLVGSWQLAVGRGYYPAPQSYLFTLRGRLCITFQREAAWFQQPFVHTVRVTKLHLETVNRDSRSEYYEYKTKELL